MKLLTKLFWLVSCPVILASPVQVDVNIHVDIPEDTEHVLSRPTRQIASTTTYGKPVDLGYETHLPSPDKEGRTYYAFENIPYAKQPVGKLRFKEAKALDDDDYPDNPPTNDGQNFVVCPQEQVGWVPFAKRFNVALFSAFPLPSRFESPILPEHYEELPKESKIPLQDEACLMLDVFVPKRVYDDESVPFRPVIVSFHGGGFIFGSKGVQGSPDGILAAAGNKEAKDDVIVVSVNYRLGAFGWLGGSKFAEQGGFENAGLSDQKVALEWVQNNIRTFGGDPYQVTALGESAGASSILHHLTAYGFSRERRYPPAFQRAILQSPAFFPLTSQRQMNTTYDNFLAKTGAKNFEELQKVDTKVLIQANRETTYYSPYGTFTYGPVVSEDQKSYVVVPPAMKLQTGAWFWNVKLMFANNREEGALFTPPWLRNKEALGEYIKSIYPDMDKESLEEFEKLYPVPQSKFSTNPKGEKTTEKERFISAAAAFGDLGVDCNAFALRHGVRKEENYQYYYRLYPGIHGQDIGATWWPEAGDELSKANPKEQSERLQRWITCFAKDDEGNPNCNKKTGDSDFNTISNYNTDKNSAMWIGKGQIVLDKDGDQEYGMSDQPGGMPKSDICDFWNSAPYWNPDADTASILRTHNLRVQNGHAFEL